MGQRHAQERFFIDKRVARWNALWVTLALAGFLLTGAWWILAFLLLDFLSRGFFNGRMSPLAGLSRRVVALMKSGPQPQWGAPKIFAAKLGCAFSLVTLAASALGADLPSRILAASFIVLTSLETFAGYCVACQIHSAFYRVRSLRGTGQGTQV